MANWTKANLRTQFNRAAANGWVGAFVHAAQKNNLPIDVLIAIASRESNMRNVVGDGGHGYSLMQIDDRSFAEWIKAGHWKDPNAAIDMGAHVLREKRREVANLGVRSGGILSQINSEEAEADLMRTAIAAYNCGSTRAYNNLVKYGDPDRSTTGKDYSADVLKRAAVFRGLYNDLYINADPQTFISNDVDSATTTPAELPTESPNLVQSGTVSPVDGPPAPTTPEVVVGATGVDKSGAKKSWIAVVFAALATIGINTWDFFATGYQAIKSNPIAVVISVATIAAICFIYGKYQDRQTKLDEAREQRAHEINMAKLKFAADKNSNTVELVPAVVPAPNPMEGKS